MKILIILLCIICLNALAKSSNESSLNDDINKLSNIMKEMHWDKLNEAEIISKKFHSGKINETDYILEIKKCSDIGNGYCTLQLGEYYLNKKVYYLAYPLLIKAANYTTGLPCPAETAVYYLGQMYWHGFGVLQDYGKALIYLTRSAKYGNSESAMFIGVIYGQKALNFNKKASSEFNHNMVNGYAWLKTAQAIQTNFINGGKNGNTTELSKVIAPFKNYLTSISALETGDHLAKHICSTIRACQQ